MAGSDVTNDSVAVALASRPAMDTSSIGPAVQALRHLIRVDLDAVAAYNQAIAAVGDPELLDLLKRFRSDHERHVADLGGALRELGATPPTQPHFTALGLAGFTRLVAGAGTASALMAMQSNEVVTTQAYELALAEGIPRAYVDLVRRNRQDEEHHLSTFRRWLEERSPFWPLLGGMATAQGIGTSVWLNALRGNPGHAGTATFASLLMGAFSFGDIGRMHRTRRRRRR